MKYIFWNEVILKPVPDKMIRKNKLEELLC